uniref:Zinc finger and BTB domain containing 5 n=1 Tax=Periophthalmus magnuspinnatus TaxID=409849 RepID=A0A3B4AZ52_9GOBI
IYHLPQRDGAVAYERMDFQSHFQYIFRQLNYQRLHAQLCDCVVLVGGQTFQAHRAILAASSSHFRALLSSNDSGDEGGGPSTNKSECGGPTVMALDPEVVTPEAFSTLLDMIYTSTLSLGSSNVMDVLLAASHLHLNAVVKACKLHLSKKNFPSAPPKGWRSVGDTEDDPVGLDSLSDLAFSCFLNPTTESVIGALEEDSLASLTAAATEAAAASDATIPMDNSSLCQNEDQSNSSSIQSSDSSLAFPVTSVPLQQLLPTQSSGFTDTLILQPAPNPLTGYLSSLGPGLTLEASVIQPSSNVKSRAAGSSGVTSFRRIAPKVPPESEVSSDPSRETAERPSLTRASEDVMSKCKKAAAEDHVLLVEGDKKYACKMCCKTFMNLTDCKKHIRVHTGEKPYPCPKCGKRFSQSSHLYKHTKNSLGGTTNVWQHHCKQGGVGERQDKL